MLFNTTLPTINAGLTYCAEIGLGYLLAWAVCGLVRDPRYRLRIWGALLSLSALGWFLLCILEAHANSLPLTDRVVSLPANPVRHPIWTLPASEVAQVNGLATWAWRIYLLLLILSVLHLELKSLRLRVFLGNAEEPSTELSALFQRLCRQMNVPGCRLLLHADLRSPATTGWLRPQILLPTDLPSFLEGHQLSDVLRHELTHVRRRDYLWDRLSAMACRVVFFHPAIWLAYRRLRQEREMVCDLAVVRNRPELRLRYAECLAKVARWWFAEDRNSFDAISFASSASLLSIRVRALLGEPGPRSRLTPITRSVLVVSVAGLAGYLPATGASFFGFDSGASVLTPAVTSRSLRAHALRTRPSRARTGKTSGAALSRPETVAARPQTGSPPPDLFSGINSAALPRLVAGTPDAAGAGSEGEGAEKPAALYPVWDEAGSLPSSASRADWRGLVTGAVAAGVAVRREGKEQEGAGGVAAGVPQGRGGKQHFQGEGAGR